MSYFFLDTDKSTASIGGPEAVERMFGIPPLEITGGAEQVRKILREKLSEEVLETIDHPLFHDSGSKRRVIRLKSKVRKLGMNGLIIDSLSTLGYQTREALKAEYKTPSMDLQLWGKYGERMMALIEVIKDLEVPVIITAHVDRDRDENGGPIEVPALKGAAKLEAARFFDVIVYTQIKQSRKGGRDFSWQIIGDARRSQAKSRLPYETDTGIIDQDFGPILKHYKDHGIDNPKILVIGDSGTGKTTSLKTLITEVE